MTEIPDPDAMKMFVGQVPKAWTEEDVRAVFEEFGRIYSVSVLRDKVTKQSRGCSFITFFTRKSALEAQNACHNVRVLPGMSHPMQMKPADNENRHERKIFVGMLTKSLDEGDLRKLFMRFGLIEEASILRDGNGTSRGCGFVTFASKASAQSAIANMNQSTILDGCSAPLVVKIADVQPKGEKSGRTVDRHGSTKPSLGSSILSPNTQQCYMALIRFLQQQQQQNHCPNMEPLLHLPQAQSGPAYNEVSMLNLVSGGYFGSLPPTSNGDPGHATTLPQFMSGKEDPLPGGLNLNQLFMQQMLNMSTPPLPRTNTQPEGPDGSNLFIYHLPPEFSDADLVQCFSPYGLILSAKVFIDKSTNLSKCFGFVSYDNSLSAQLAINGLNGFQIGAKRLKVQLKRPKEKPY